MFSLHSTQDIINDIVNCIIVIIDDIIINIIVIEINIINWWKISIHIYLMINEITKNLHDTHPYQEAAFSAHVSETSYQNKSWIHDHFSRFLELLNSINCWVNFAIYLRISSIVGSWTHLFNFTICPCMFFYH